MNTSAKRFPRQIVSPAGTVHEVDRAYVDWSPGYKVGKLRPVPLCAHPWRGGYSVDIRRAVRHCGLCSLQRVALMRRRRPS